MGGGEGVGGGYFAIEHFMVPKRFTLLTFLLV